MATTPLQGVGRPIPLYASCTVTERGGGARGVRAQRLCTQYEALVCVDETRVGVLGVG